ncbi:MAG: UDP-N-acetyl-D-mannosamine dehydrogenase [Pseudomonadales bacterium]|nr:UDP-N-acetyl-D-mannosamine dehydrogenase [Pseudomonadales bacterium]
MAYDKSICVVGLGYIGLPTASLLATKGFDVVGVDIDPEVVDTINKGNIHIVEPDLDILVKSAVNSGKLKASMQPVEADVFIIAVPTPFKDEKEPNLAYVEAATKTICPLLKKGDLVILESTVPVGTTDDVVLATIALNRDDLVDEVNIAHCPERVLPGQILRELIENDRVVGGVDERSTDAAVEFYESFVSGEVLATSAKTAEMAKLTENAYRDVNIAFANELSMICDEQAINVWEMIRLANRHPRVNILNPGPGVGGHCIAVDPWFIVSSAPETAKLIRTARSVNDAKPNWVIDRISRYADRFKDPVIGCLGLAFKADVDDLRESPALDIVQALNANAEWQVLVSEPNVDQMKEFDLLPYDEVIERSDIVVILVDHKKFRKIKASDLKEKVVIDTRGVVS